MPLLVEPLIPAGRFSGVEQPVIPVAGGLVARPWRAGDAAAVVAAFADPSIQRWHTRRVDGEDEAAGWIGQWRRAWREETAAHWAIADARTGAVLGRVSLQRFILVGGQAEIAYWVVPGARGAGVCTRAVDAVAGWALRDGGFHRVELGHSVANPASCRVAEKTGFALEGVRRRAVLHTDGLHDMHLHARLRPAAGGEAQIPL
ncbi:GNAT family protein [Streptomyces sp. RFCAC02]|uniref:GNAT family N-acetyltransferase n=1 Tax=Streptomyces sp. RFCAC02 TaxID=2499143 RepID=UPI001020AFA4|nr:GNAT family protein [Streptomyces sp. RFCAC02]